MTSFQLAAAVPLFRTEQSQSKLNSHGKAKWKLKSITGLSCCAVQLLPHQIKLICKRQKRAMILINPESKHNTRSVDPFFFPVENAQEKGGRKKQNTPAPGASFHLGSSMARKEEEKFFLKTPLFSLESLFCSSLLLCRRSILPLAACQPMNCLNAATFP